MHFALWKTFGRLTAPFSSATYLSFQNVYCVNIFLRRFSLQREELAQTWKLWRKHALNAIRSQKLMKYSYSLMVRDRIWTYM